MTDRQRRFAEEFAVDFNGAAAARRAGYSERTARQIAVELLSKPDVQAMICAARDRCARQAMEQEQVTRGGILSELAAVGFSDIRDMMESLEGGGFRFKPLAQFSEKIAKSVAGIKVRQERDAEGYITADIIEVKLWNKIAALKELAELIGLKAGPEERDRRPVPLGIKIVVLPNDYRGPAPPFVREISSDDGVGVQPAPGPTPGTGVPG